MTLPWTWEQGRTLVAALVSTNIFMLKSSSVSNSRQVGARSGLEAGSEGGMEPEEPMAESGALRLRPEAGPSGLRPEARASRPRLEADWCGWRPKRGRLRVLGAPPVPISAIKQGGRQEVAFFPDFP